MSQVRVAANMDRGRSPTGASAAAPLLALLAALLVPPHAGARAFSDPFSYETSIAEGGGGGRWFTGSPADGFGCDVCHGDVGGVDLSVEGLPSESGYTPGQPYQIIVRWPETVEHLALVVEFVDARGMAAGSLALPLPEAQTTLELCSDLGLEDVSAGQVLQSETGRQLAAVIDCGARELRMRWMAPDRDVGAVWFSGGFVASDHQSDIFNDRVVHLDKTLVAAGSGQHFAQLAQGACSVAARVDSRGAPAGALSPGALLALLCVHRLARRRGALGAAPTAARANRREP